jgi:hypothetical protein
MKETGGFAVFPWVIQSPAAGRFTSFSSSRLQMKESVQMVSDRKI